MRTILVILLGVSMALAGTEYEKAVAESVERAIEQYPDADNEGTPLFVAIAKQVENLKSTAPDFFNNPKWPEMLAASEAARLGIKSAAPASSGLHGMILRRCIGRMGDSVSNTRDVQLERGAVYRVVEANPRGVILKDARGHKIRVKNDEVRLFKPAPERMNPDPPVSEEAVLLQQQNALLRAQINAQEEISDQLLRLRIQQAYPNNPEMWRYLEKNPRYIEHYLQGR